MKTRSLRITALLLLLCPFVMAEAQESQCTLCTGSTSASGTVAVPLLVETVDTDTEGALRRLATLDEEARAGSVLAIDVTIDPDYPVDAIESRLRQLAIAVREAGPIAAAAYVVPRAVSDLDGFIMRRMSIAMQAETGLERFGLLIRDMESFESLSRSAGAISYFDFVIAPELLAEPLMEWIVENDPAKRMQLLVRDLAPNPLYDVARGWDLGAELSWLDSDEQEVLDAQRELNTLLAGDFIVDTTAAVDLLDGLGAPRTAASIVLVRGSDLRTVIIPEGGEGATIIGVAASDFDTPLVLDATGTRPSNDSAERGGRLLVGIARSDLPHAVAFDRPILADPEITREQIEITETRTIPVEEIVRDHQAYWDYQRGNEPRWIARNETSLRFPVGPSGDVIEATIAGNHFFDGKRLSDWVWEDLFINGVRWKYGRIPEMPLMQPEKVTELPLEINLSRDYQYRLVRETELAGYDVWEIAFEPPIDAPAGLPLYKGRVWIDKDTYARIAIATIQLNLEGGEILSNEERVTYQPWDRNRPRVLSRDEVEGRNPQSILWLPMRIDAQQSLSAAGRVVAVQRATRFTEVEIGPESFEQRLRAANESRFRMVRDTEEGLRYLERTDSGERVVKTEIDTSRMFVLAGLQHDDGLEYGVLPLAGVNYLNFDLFDRGLQTNIFFAGVFTAANLTDPSLFGSRANAGVDFFGLAIPFEQSSYRQGVEVESEAVEALPVGLTFRIGHPFADFGKADLSLGITSVSFGAADTTDPEYIIPQDTLVISPSLSVRYDRWGYSLSSFAEFNERTDWEPWGDLDHYSDEQKDFFKWGVSLSKSIHLPKFQRLGLGLEYVTGSDLDRFSKYELGFFGSNRVRGFPSGSVQAETATFGHLSYGLVISDQIRVEGFYDIALIDDEISGYEAEPFQGIGVAGQTVGPYGTVLRLDVGKSIGPNSRDGFVASLVVLKILDR